MSRNFFSLKGDDSRRNLYRAGTKNSPNAEPYTQLLIKRLSKIPSRYRTSAYYLARGALEAGVALTIEELKNSGLTQRDQQTVSNALFTSYILGLEIQGRDGDKYLEVSREDLDSLCGIFCLPPVTIKTKLRYKGIRIEGVEKRESFGPRRNCPRDRHTANPRKYLRVRGKTAS